MEARGKNGNFLWKYERKWRTNEVPHRKKWLGKVLGEFEVKRKEKEYNHNRVCTSIMFIKNNLKAEQ